MSWATIVMAIAAGAVDPGWRFRLVNMVNHKMFWSNYRMQRLFVWVQFERDSFDSFITCSVISFLPFFEIAELLDSFVKFQILSFHIRLVLGSALYSATAPDTACTKQDLETSLLEVTTPRPNLKPPTF